MDLRLRRGILESVSNYLKNKGFSDFRADLEDFDQPKKIVEKRSGEIYQPDMTAFFGKECYYFEIEMGEEIDSSRDDFVRKCSILQQHAASKDGKLYLIVPEDNFEKVLQVINRNNLENVGILQIRTG
jgi:hypothetical protein